MYLSNCCYSQNRQKSSIFKCRRPFSFVKMPLMKNKITVKTKADRISQREMAPQFDQSSSYQAEQIYEVQSILKKRVRGDLQQYLVKWKGYPLSQATWQPKSNMTNCPNIILQFELSQLPQQARQDLAETEETFKPSTDPLPPTIYDHNLNAVRPNSTLINCHILLTFLKEKMQKQATLLPHQQVIQILQCEKQRGEKGLIFGVRIGDGQLRRLRRQELCKGSKLRLVEFYERQIRQH